VPVSRLDESAGRILQLKEDLGLFETPLPDPNSPLLATIGSAEDREVALNLCRESVTLLENPNNVRLFLPSKQQKQKQKTKTKTTTAFALGSLQIPPHLGDWTLI